MPVINQLSIIFSWFQARKTDRKLNRVALLISVKDVKMTDLESGDVCFDISIYR